MNKGTLKVVGVATGTAGGLLEIAAVPAAIASFIGYFPALESLDPVMTKVIDYIPHLNSLIESHPLAATLVAFPVLVAGFIASPVITFGLLAGGGEVLQDLGDAMLRDAAALKNTSNPTSLDLNSPGGGMRQLKSHHWGQKSDSVESGPIQTVNLSVDKPVSQSVSSGSRLALARTQSGSQRLQLGLT